MADPRAKHFAKLGRLRRSARRWTVAAGTFLGATAVLLPYHGIGALDALWAAAAGGSSALAWWRWRDFREMAAAPAPEELTAAQRAAMTQRRIEAFVGRLPVGNRAITEVHRFAHLSRLRGSSVAETGARLDRATRTLATLAPRLTGPGNEVLLEASMAEGALRDLAERTASVERALKIVSPDDPAQAQLVAAHADLLNRFQSGVGAYEGLVAAAGAVVAEMGRLGEPVAVDRLVEATDRVRGIASGIAEFTATMPRASQA
jgi:hypothetical protein